MRRFTLLFTFFFITFLPYAGSGQDTTAQIKSEAKKIIKAISKIERKKRKLKKPYLSAKVKKYCNKVEKKFKKYRWGKSNCHKLAWHHVRNSVKGDPLIWMAYGDEKEHKKDHKDTTFFFCGIHGDEITPVKLCYDLILYMEKNQKYYRDRMVVIAPIVNPDSFFIRRPTRTNANGVDINRNFPTRDWAKDALRLWKRRYRRDKRRYPGKHPASEPSVVFQMNLIKRYRPDKIIAVHSPLTLLDYDGPEDMKGKSVVASLASKLLIQMSNLANGYNVKDYPFFPGSLGNWAGNERNIPTYTLELPNSDPHKHEYFWGLFQESLYSAILLDLRNKDIALINN